MKRISFFDDQRLTLNEAIELTAQALTYYITQYPDVVVSFSGGKDSTSLLTLLLVLIETGRVPKPKSLRILLANTRIELPLLHLAALEIIRIVRERGYSTEVVEPPLDESSSISYLFTRTPASEPADVLSPLLHWRVCHVADWLMLAVYARHLARAIAKR